MRLSRLALVAAFLVVLSISCSSQSKVESFAKCLASKQVKMYGAFWCPHCKDQKDLFGEAFSYVTYVECAVPGKPPNVRSEACQQMDIKKYPTWIFPDGERVEAVLPLKDLAQKAGCPAPPEEKK